MCLPQLHHRIGAHALPRSFALAGLAFELQSSQFCLGRAQFEFLEDEGKALGEVNGLGVGEPVMAHMPAGEDAEPQSA
jgi:hypothetical protein